RCTQCTLLRQARVGSSSGSGVSCGGLSFSGTLRRLTRMRVHVEDRPRIESTRTSSTANCFAASGFFFFQRSRPANALSLSGELATTINGIFVRAFGAAFFVTVLFVAIFFVAVFFVAALAPFAREGATRGASPSILRKCGGQ